MKQPQNLIAKLLASIPIALLLSTMPVHADEKDERIQALEQKVMRLEKRIAHIEALLLQRAKAGQPVKPAPRGDWRKKANWRSLKKGMTKDQVKRLLGEPSNVSTGGLEHWSYSDGSVAFDGDTNLVWGWHEPTR